LTVKSEGKEYDRSYCETMHEPSILQCKKLFSPNSAAVHQLTLCTNNVYIRPTTKSA